MPYLKNGKHVFLGGEILNFPNFNLVRKRVYLKEGGIFHPSSGVVQLVVNSLRSCRPVISSQVKEHPPLHRSRKIRCIDRVTFALPPMIPLPEGSISNRVTGELHLFQFQRLSPIEVGSNANIRFQRNRFLGNLGHWVFEDFDAFYSGQ